MIPTPMKMFCAALVLLPAVTGQALAASAINLDSEARTIVVTEGSSTTELRIGPGDSVDFCPDGCFVTMPDGSRAALTGDESVEISGGVGSVK